MAKVARQRTRTRLNGRRDNGASVPSGANRDGKGRFQPGNRAGRGHGRPREDLRQQIRACVTDDDLKNIMKNVILRASKGSERHARLLLEYCVGRPAVAKDTGPINVALPPCASAAECVEANSRIFEAVGKGDITIDQAVALASIVQGARSAIEALDQESRLQMLEELRT